jgi:HAD superfamily, subfamily IIIB (Acid phosphatase)
LRQLSFYLSELLWWNFPPESDESFGRIGRRARPQVHAIAVSALVIFLATVTLAHAQGAHCPLARQPTLPPATDLASNLDKHKGQLREYHETAYLQDIASVIGDARAWVDRGASEARWPAVVLDVDETALSNWENIKQNDFGFVKAGPCLLKAQGACGFDDWILKAEAPAIEPTRTFFNFLRARNISVFFITGRRDSQRDATILNLDHAGFQGWAKLVTRPDSDAAPSIIQFKSGEREKIEAAGYSIIANIGDQESDLEPKNESKYCFFKLPNPFYFIN